MPTGKVKWYDAAKGFGFLSQEDGEDVYVRSSALPAGVEGLKAGQRVEFGVASGRRGPQALSLKLIDPPPSLTRPRREGPGRRADAGNPGLAAGPGQLDRRRYGARAATASRRRSAAAPGEVSGEW